MTPNRRNTLLTSGSFKVRNQRHGKIFTKVFDLTTSPLSSLGEYLDISLEMRNCVV